MDNNVLNKHLPDGTLLFGGRYRIVRFLASGGFGCTYEAEHTQLGLRVAIKEYFFSDFCKRDEHTTRVITWPNKVDLVEKQREKFKREAKTIAQMKHSGIVRVTDIFDENDTSYYVMDFIEGCSLGYVVKQQGPLPESVAVDYIRQVCDALQYMHERKVLHLDIKPGNIMLGRDNKTVLIDFGAARQYDVVSGNATTTRIPCTPGYAPIEQMEANVKRLGESTDIYAVGATLYKLLTGVTPPSASSLLSGSEELVFPATMSPYLQSAIRAAMQPRKTDRPASARAFAAMLTPTAASAAPQDDRTTLDNEVKLQPKPVQPSPIRISVEPKKSEKAKSIAQKYKEKAQKVAQKTAQKLKSKDKPVDGNADPKIKRTALLAIGSLVSVAAILVLLIATGVFKTGSSSSTELEDSSYRKVVDSSYHKVVEAPVPVLGWDSDTDEIFYGENRYKMVKVDGGTFTMGATSEQEDDAKSNEELVHDVTLSDYYIGKTEVPQWLWVAVMDSNPSVHKGDNLPVEKVSYDDCKEFISRLNDMTGLHFRLPTEAQWEFAARGGNKGGGNKYAGTSSTYYLEDYAWFEDNSGGHTHEVGTKRPNELGLYDMSGNVNEWCNDWKGSYSSSSQTDPTGPESGLYRVYRGGSWSISPRCCRVSFRGSSTPVYGSVLVGFRLAF